MTEKAIKLEPWVITLIISIIINIMGGVYITATVVTQIQALTDRVARIERVMDRVTNITRGGPALAPEPADSGEMVPQHPSRF